MVAGQSGVKLLELSGERHRVERGTKRWHGGVSAIQTNRSFRFHFDL